jgi:phosphoribosyl-ATP pyrophosphohydrolase/phosphoribosyl-AMP cyclohydrolase
VKIDFNKHPDGLVPAVIQDEATQRVLMLGYMNSDALQRTMETGLVTFYSRSKMRLWKKGEESGHTLQLKSLAADCDNDTLLIKVHPTGPVCHTGSDTCWNEKNHPDDFLQYLEGIIDLRKKTEDGSSYVRSLMDKGIGKVAQKVGEEAVELVIEAMGQDDERFRNEAADLLFHYLVLLNSKGHTLHDISETLRKRHKP